MSDRIELAGAVSGWPARSRVSHLHHVRLAVQPLRAHAERGGQIGRSGAGAVLLHEPVHGPVLPRADDYVGGQNGVGAEGKVVRPTVGKQARQALRNLATVLDSERASLANIVHWSIAVVDGHAPDEGFAAFQQAWNPAGPPPAITVHIVAGLGPGFLVEIDAITVV